MDVPMLIQDNVEGLTHKETSIVWGKKITDATAIRTVSIVHTKELFSTQMNIM